jgi:hypothetical protein
MHRSKDTGCNTSFDHFVGAQQADSGIVNPSAFAVWFMTNLGLYDI